ncbi:hypothetical protein K438DRAFT_108613 [Mycena galopus ATCC 62051]|nr:hypothetical protein K438DRAFT_108613 [Mycena galopus ATCC 62051]
MTWILTIAERLVGVGIHYGRVGIHKWRRSVESAPYLYSSWQFRGRCAFLSFMSTLLPYISSLPPRFHPSPSVPPHFSSYFPLAFVPQSFDSYLRHFWHASRSPPTRRWWPLAAPPVRRQNLPQLEVGGASSLRFIFSILDLFSSEVGFISADFRVQRAFDSHKSQMRKGTLPQSNFQILTLPLRAYIVVLRLFGALRARGPGGLDICHLLPHAAPPSLFFPLDLRPRGGCPPPAVLAKLIHYFLLFRESSPLQETFLFWKVCRVGA